MNDIILKKENNEVIKGTRETISDTAYMTKEENCFKDNIDQSKVENFDLDSIKMLNKQINIILNEISDEDYSIINELYNMIQKIKSFKDLKLLCTKFISEYLDFIEQNYTFRTERIRKIKKVKKRISEDLEKNFDIILSVLIKNIINKYYKDKLLKLDENSIKKLENMIINGNSNEYIFKELNISFDEQSEENGVKKLSSKILLNNINKIYDSRQIHLCWLNCKNASPCNCQKVFDTPKRKINEYDFIKEGYQVINNNNEIQTFVISKCDNYVRQEPKKLTVRERRRINKIKEELAINYFDAGSIKEAKAIQKYLIKTGQIKSK